MMLADILTTAFLFGLITIPLSGLYLLFSRKKTKEDYIHEMKILSIIALIAVGIPAGYRSIQQYAGRTQASPDIAISDYQIQQFEDRYEITFHTTEPVYTYAEAGDTVLFPSGGYQQSTIHVYHIPRTGIQRELTLYINGTPAQHRDFPLILQ